MKEKIRMHCNSTSWFLGVAVSLLRDVQIQARTYGVTQMEAAKILWSITDRDDYTVIVKAEKTRGPFVDGEIWFSVSLRDLEEGHVVIYNDAPADIEILAGALAALFPKTEKEMAEVMASRVSRV